MMMNKNYKWLTMNFFFEMSELELIQNNLDELNGFVQMDDSLYVKDDAFTLFKNKVEIAKNLMADPINKKKNY